jgi:ABC-2 type transport system ATP-binding protein
MTPAVSIRDLYKTYDSGFQALKGVNLDIFPGEIFALLGPNGAGKSTLIGAICGLVRPSSGSIAIDGQPLPQHYREARVKIGLVPQDLVSQGFESVWSAVRFSRGLFGKAPDAALLERLLRELSLWDKREASTLELSGGMRRRVMIAKALAHEPTILFLDEPSAGVDIELRMDMWAMVRRLRDRGVTIVLTTHYLEEAEQMADRIGVISDGQLRLVENKAAMIKRLGRRRVHISLTYPLAIIPTAFSSQHASLDENGRELIIEIGGEQSNIEHILNHLSAAKIRFTDLRTSESSLEDIFINILRSTQ